MPQGYAKNEIFDLVIVGAGPAGLGAAQQASQLGLAFALLDAYPRPGGQYFKQPPGEFHVENEQPEAADRLLSEIAPLNMLLLNDTVVWGIFPEDGKECYELCLYSPTGKECRMVARNVILTPGAYDRPLPFAGWTLPGVMTAGAAMTLLKSQRLLPGSRALLSGTGPLQLVLARQLIEAGTQVMAVLDANPFPWRAWRSAPVFWGQWERLYEGWQCWWTMHHAGLSIRWGMTICRAEGNGQVEQAVITPLAGGKPETIPVDLVCLGYGFTPAIQLSWQAGCEHQYRPECGGYVPLRDEWLQTTLPGVFVAGDGAGIGGKDVALLEGRLAALGAASRLGRQPETRLVASLRRDLAHQRRFASLLSQLFPFQEGLLDLMTDDTILCRCEEVTLKEIRQAIANGATTVNAVKALTRAGMGRCQGRMCAQSIAAAIARQTSQTIEKVGYFYPHAPVVPIPLAGLIDQNSELEQETTR